MFVVSLDYSIAVSIQNGVSFRNCPAGFLYWSSWGLGRNGFRRVDISVCQLSRKFVMVLFRVRMGLECWFSV